MSIKKKVAIIVLILLIIPSTFFGLLYYQMSNLQVSVSVEEAQVISWIWDILNGRTPNLIVRLTFTNPTFLQVDVSDILAQLYVEDEFALETTIESLFIPAGQTVHKDLTFSVSDALRVYNMINQASQTYGGEVKITITGRATTHLIFFSTRLPYSVTRYFMTKEPTLQFDSAKWTDANGQTISTCKVSDQVKIQVSLKNPTRTRTITNLIKVEIYRDILYGFDEKITTTSQSKAISPSSTDTVSLVFTPPQESGYHFTIFVEDKQVYTQPNAFPPRLRVSRFTSSLTLDKPPSSVSVGSTVLFTGKLINKDTEEGIAGATIKIYDSDPGFDDLLISGTTRSDGTFSIEWTAKKGDWYDNTTEVFAKFEEIATHLSSQSEQYVITVT